MLPGARTISRRVLECVSDPRRAPFHKGARGRTRNSNDSTARIRKYAYISNGFAMTLGHCKGVCFSGCTPG